MFEYIKDAFERFNYWDTHIFPYTKWTWCTSKRTLIAVNQNRIETVFKILNTQSNVICIVAIKHKRYYLREHSNLIGSCIDSKPLSFITNCFCYIVRIMRLYGYLSIEVKQFVKNVVIYRKLEETTLLIWNIAYTITNLDCSWKHPIISFVS